MDKVTRKAQIVIAGKDTPQQNKFLLLKTNEERGGYWQNCTGKIEEGEEFISGAIREVMEETGLHKDNILEVVDLELEHLFHDRWGRDVCERAYLIVVKVIWPVLIDHGEHQDFKWISLDELNSESVKYPGNFEALKKAESCL